MAHNGEEFIAMLACLDQAAQGRQVVQFIALGRKSRCGRFNHFT
jgi:hypothetical protein